MEPQPLKLRYTGCGSETRAPCDCGKPFKLIRPAKAAALAVKAHPRKSDRAIVSEIGVNDRCCSIESTKQTDRHTADRGVRRIGQACAMLDNLPLPVAAAMRSAQACGGL
jgi:hypothetical protein